MRVTQDTAVITGGTGNLGSAVTRRFLADGYRIVVPWNEEWQWKQFEGSLSGEMKRRCLGVQADVTQEESVQAIIHRTAEEFGRLDVLLNLVGGYKFGRKIWEMDVETWDTMMNVNLRSAFLCCKHALSLMIAEGAGRIVNVSSRACIDIQPGAAAYAVAKRGIVTLTRALREELKGAHITVNAIMPGIIDSPRARKLMRDGSPQQWVKPEEIADVLAALCSGELKTVSGSVIRVFGGL